MARLRDADGHPCPARHHAALGDLDDQSPWRCLKAGAVRLAQATHLPALQAGSSKPCFHATSTAAHIMVVIGQKMAGASSTDLAAYFHVKADWTQQGWAWQALM